MNLYKLTTMGLGDYYVMAHEPTAAQTRLERLLNQANYGYKDARAVINIQLVSNELVDSWMDDKKANFNNKDRFLGVPLLCEEDFEPKFKMGEAIAGNGSMQELQQKIVDDIKKSGITETEPRTYTLKEIERAVYKTQIAVIDQDFVMAQIKML